MRISKRSASTSFALKKDLPIQQGVLQSILAMKSPSALHQDVTALLDRLTQLPKHSEATQALTQAVRTVVNAETTVHAEKLLSVLLGAKEGQTKQGESLQLVQPHVNPAQQTKQSQPAAIQGRQVDTVNQNSVQQLLSQNSSRFSK